VRLAGDAIAEVDTRGARIVDNTLLILLNAHYEPLSFTLPAHRPETQWELVLDTREATGRRERTLAWRNGSYELESRSLALFRLYQDDRAAREQRDK
jgi:glycogen operon protein